MHTMIALAAIAAGILSATAAHADPRLRHVRTLEVDADTWYPFNTASFDQEKVTSFGDFQYTVYWDTGKVMELARRDLRDHAVQTVRLPKCRLTTNPNDGHRNTVIGMSHADGWLHLSWDHHNNPLRYTRSCAGFLTDPPRQVTADDFEPPQPLMPDDKLESRVTYPRFLNDNEGKLGNSRLHVTWTYRETGATWASNHDLH